MNENTGNDSSQRAFERQASEVESQGRLLFEQVIDRMQIQPRDRILDVGCGEGWAARLMAKLVPEGTVVGLDSSDEMIHNARAKSAAYENLIFVWGEAEAIPWQENFFSKIVCLESFPYFKNAETALREIFRVTSPRGSVWVLHGASKDNQPSLRWRAEVGVPMQLSDAEEYRQLFAQAGFQGYRHEMISDPAGLEQSLITAVKPG